MLLAQVGLDGAGRHRQTPVRVYQRGRLVLLSGKAGRPVPTVRGAGISRLALLVAARQNGGRDMENEMMFLDCPAYMDSHGAERCGLPAEVEDQYTVQSSDGPLISMKIRCPVGHWFNGPLESLTLVSPADVAEAFLRR
jgi:hypothetical protein